MDLVEYQGKQLFARNGVPVPPPGVVCRTPDEVEAAARELGGMTVIKAQVKMGGRGKAGGVKLAKSPEEAREHAEAIFGLDIKGHVVNVIYVEPGSDIAEEYYLSIMHDRVGKGYLVICSREGGMDIEEVNRTNPDAVVKESLLPSETADGLPRDRALDIVTRASFPEDVLDEAADLLVALFGAMKAEDATLMEINPLIKTEDGRVIALDSKVSLDNNAAFRHDDYAEWEVEGLEPADPQEQAAKEAGIQYVKLDGDVGVLGNGAGLVMASLDVVAQAGGQAANFLDIGGGASAETMAESLRLVLSDDRVQSVLVNIFGGITRCDLVAEGVLGAMDQLGDIEQKLVVRLDGTHAGEGRAMLTDANHPNVVAAATMAEAAERAVAFATEA
jgi:succinyl-CoA synthetase beta subunit